MTISSSFEELNEKTKFILAKKGPSVTLAKHIYDCLIALKEYFEENEGLWRQNWKRISLISYEEAKKLLLLSVYFHDIGKATKEFQDALEEETKSFHPFYALFVLPLSLGKLKGIPLVSLAILNHHTPYYTTVEGGLYEKVEISSPNFSKKEAFFNFYPQIIEEIFQIKVEPIFSVNNSLEEIRKVLLETKIKISNLNSASRIQIENIFYFLSGGLVFADRIASKRELNKNFSPYFKTQNVEQSLKKSISGFKCWKNFQTKVSQMESSVFLGIPTGEGKTEAALLWAENNLKNKYTKIIYTLPTRVASNKIYERMKKALKDNEIGLVHSDAKFVLEEEFPEISERQKLALEYYLRKYFFLPFTVGTLDSLLIKFLHSGRWDVARFNLQNSLIIVDEIHTYNPRLLGFLLKTLEILASFSNKFILMSASMPEVIKRKFEKHLNFKTYGGVYQEEILFEKSPGFIQKCPCLLSDAKKEIISEWEKGKNVLVICNTVKEAKNLYNQLKEEFEENILENVVLYHSEFTHIDRMLKEDEIYFRLGKISWEELKSEQVMINRELKDFKEIIPKNLYKKPYILISTQVAEVSLDIDFSILFTERAPIDALIQRFGRVNRKKLSEKRTAFKIFEKLDTGEKGKWRYPYPKEIIDITWETIKEGDFTIRDTYEWLNNVYSESNTFGKNCYKKEFEYGYNLYEKILSATRSISELSIPEDKLDEFVLRPVEKGLKKISVIPVQIYDAKNLKFKGIREQYLNAVDIYLYRKFTNQAIIQQTDWVDILVNKNYDYLYGIDWGEDEFISF